MPVVKAHDAFLTVQIAGRPVLGYWETHQQPSVSWSTGRYRPGGQIHAVATRGLPDRGTGQVSKTITPSDLAAIRQIERDGDRGGRIEVTEQPRDAQGNPFGQPRIFTGIMSSVEVSDFDNDSDDNRMLTVSYQADDVAG